MDPVTPTMSPISIRVFRCLLNQHLLFDLAGHLLFDLAGQAYSSLLITNCLVSKAHEKATMKTCCKVQYHSLQCADLMIRKQGMCSQHHSLETVWCIGVECLFLKIQLDLATFIC